MSLLRPLTCGLLIAVCALHATAARVKVQASIKDGAKEAAKGETKQVENSTEPEGEYWHTHKGSWNLIGLVDEEHLQQFELKEDYRLLRTKKYKAKLDQWEDPETFVEVRKNINSKVLTLENHFWTMHGTQTATFEDEKGTHVGEYVVFKPNVFNRRWTWRVAKSDDQSNILFTIQKRLWNDNCKYFGWFSCKPVLKIYVGHRGDKDTLIYYGVGDRDLDEPDFKFYHSQDSYKANKKRWVAKVDHKKTKRNGEDKYKVKVMPGEDAALLLLATTCLDQIGDSARSNDPDHHYDDDHY